MNFVLHREKDQCQIKSCQCELMYKSISIVIRILICQLKLPKLYLHPPFKGKIKQGTELGHYPISIVVG